MIRLRIQLRQKETSGLEGSKPTDQNSSYKVKSIVKSTQVAQPLQHCISLPTVNNFIKTDKDFYASELVAVWVVSPGTRL